MLTTAASVTHMTAALARTEGRCGWATGATMSVLHALATTDVVKEVKELAEDSSSSTCGASVAVCLVLLYVSNHLWIVSNSTRSTRCRHVARAEGATRFTLALFLRPSIGSTALRAADPDSCKYIEGEYLTRSVFKLQRSQLLHAHSSRNSLDVCTTESASSLSLRMM